MMRMLVAAAVSVGFFGCNLCTEVETFYRGTRSGTLVIVEEGSDGSGVQLSARSGPWDDRNTLQGTSACVPAKSGASPGQVIIAWLSPDELPTVSARCVPADAGVLGAKPAACAPGATDPQGRRDYELPAFGNVVSQIELVEP